LSVEEGAGQEEVSKPSRLTLLKSFSSSLSCSVSIPSAPLEGTPLRSLDGLSTTLNASASTLFAEARRLRTDRERQASERQAALELRRLNAIERDEKALWLRVDELITSKSTKAYDEAITILKDLRALALHKEQQDEFVRRVEAIRQRYSRLSGLQRRIQDSKLLDGSESEDTP
jgi:hypothetical protein